MKPTHSSSFFAQSNISLHFHYISSTCPLHCMCPSDSFNFERRCVRVGDVCACLRMSAHACTCLRMSAYVMGRLARDLLRQLRHCFRISQTISDLKGLSGSPLICPHSHDCFGGSGQMDPYMGHIQGFTAGCIP